MVDLAASEAAESAAGPGRARLTPRRPSPRSRPTRSSPTRWPPAPSWRPSPPATARRCARRSPLTALKHRPLEPGGTRILRRVAPVVGFVARRGARPASSCAAVTAEQDPRRDDPGALASNPCSIRRGRCSGSTRASRVAGTARCRVERSPVAAPRAERSRSASSARRPSSRCPERLGRLQGELEALIEELRPSAVAVERVLFQVNVRTAMSVGQASGLALATAARAGIPVAQYSPNEVKLAVAGYGNAEKGAVQAMVVRLLNLPGPPGSPDAADALALALCHLWGAKLHATRDAAREPASGYARGRRGGRSPRMRGPDDRIRAGHGHRAQSPPARCSSRSVASGTGAWCRSAQSPASHPRARRSSSPTSTSARTR